MLGPESTTDLPIDDVASVPTVLAGDVRAEYIAASGAPGLWVGVGPSAHFAAELAVGP
jgi:hypothetical protein